MALRRRSSRQPAASEEGTRPMECGVSEEGTRTHGTERQLTPALLPFLSLLTVPPPHSRATCGRRSVQACGCLCPITSDDHGRAPAQAADCSFKTKPFPRSASCISSIITIDVQLQQCCTSSSLPIETMHRSTYTTHRGPRNGKAKEAIDRSRRNNDDTEHQGRLLLRYVFWGLLCLVSFDVEERGGVGREGFQRRTGGGRQWGKTRQALCRIEVSGRASDRAWGEAGLASSLPSTSRHAQPAPPPRPPHPPSNPTPHQAHEQTNTHTHKGPKSSSRSWAGRRPRCWPCRPTLRSSSGGWPRAGRPRRPGR